jgi:hypothetical protein
MNNKLNLLLAENELCFLKEQREKWIDDTQTFMTNNATVDK